MRFGQVPGILDYGNGIYYKGGIREGLFHGNGKMKYSDGFYKGNWSNGKRSGNGKYYDLSGNLQYEGEWIDDKPASLSQSKEDAVFAEVKLAINRCYKGYMPLTIGDETGSTTIYNCFELARDYSVTGTGEESLTIAGITYRCKVKISGKFDPESKVLVFSNGSVIHKDELPGTMYWITNSTKWLTIYNDTDRPGHFVLKGKDNNGESVSMIDN